MMNLLRLISGRTASAPVARERLQILLAHERGLRGQPDLLGVLRPNFCRSVAAYCARSGKSHRQDGQGQTCIDARGRY